METPICLSASCFVSFVKTRFLSLAQGKGIHKESSEPQALSYVQFLR